MASPDFRIDREMVFKVMKLRGLTEAIIAERLGCSIVNVCKFFDDSHMITLRTAQRLSEAMDVPIGMIAKKEVIGCHRSLKL